MVGTEKQNQHVIDTHPLARAIKLLYDELNEVKLKDRFHYNNGVWTTSMQNFAQQLGVMAMSEGIDTRDAKVWPQSPSRLSFGLNIINTNLRRQGIDVVVRKSKDKVDLGFGYKKGVSIVDIKSTDNTILGYNRLTDEDNQSNSEDGEDVPKIPSSPTKDENHAQITSDIKNSEDGEDVLGYRLPFVSIFHNNKEKEEKKRKEQTVTEKSPNRPNVLTKTPQSSCIHCRETVDIPITLHRKYCDITKFEEAPSIVSRILKSPKAIRKVDGYNA